MTYTAWSFNKMTNLQSCSPWTEVFLSRIKKNLIIVIIEIKKIFGHHIGCACAIWPRLFVNESKLAVRTNLTVPSAYAGFYTWPALASGCQSVPDEPATFMCRLWKLNVCVGFMLMRVGSRYILLRVILLDVSLSVLYSFLFRNEMV